MSTPRMPLHVGSVYHSSSCHHNYDPNTKKQIDNTFTGIFILLSIIFLITSIINIVVWIRAKNRIYNVNFFENYFMYGFGGVFHLGYIIISTIILIVFLGIQIGNLL